MGIGLHAGRPVVGAAARTGAVNPASIVVLKHACAFYGTYRRHGRSSVTVGRTHAGVTAHNAVNSATVPWTTHRCGVHGMLRQPCPGPGRPPLLSEGGEGTGRVVVRQPCRTGPPTVAGFTACSGSRAVLGRLTVAPERHRPRHRRTANTTVQAVQTLACTRNAIRQPAGLRFRVTFLAVPTSQFSPYPPRRTLLAVPSSFHPFVPSLHDHLGIYVPIGTLVNKRPKSVRLIAFERSFGVRGWPGMRGLPV